MITWLRKAAAVCLASSLILLSGCGGNEQEDKPEMTAASMGRYIEEEAEGANSVYKILDNRDGSYDLLNMDPDSYEQKIFNYKDGTLTPTKWDWVDQLDSFGELNLSAVTRDANGQIYVMAEDYTEYDHETAETVPEERVFRVLEGDQMEEVPLEWQPIHISTAEGLLISEKGDIIINKGMGGVFQYDAVTGKLKNAFTNEDWSDAAVKGDTLYLSDRDGTKVVAYSLETGEQTQELPLEGTGQNKVLLSVDSSGTLYSCSNTGVSKWVEETESWEQIIDGELNLMSLSSLNKLYFFAGPDGSFLVDYLARRETTIARYVYDENVPSRPLETLTISSLRDNQTVRAAIRLMRKKNPDVYVKYRVLMGEDSGVLREDAIKAINAELLSGKGDDLYLLDGLPIDSYLEKGVLLDISDLAAPLLEEGVGYQPIIQAYQRDGTLCAVPIRFAAPMMWGNTEFLSKVKTISDLAQWAEEHTEIPLINTLNWNQIISRFYPVCGPVWASKENGIDEEGLKTFLESVKRIADTGKAFEEEYEGITENDEDWNPPEEYVDSFSSEMLQLKEKECQIIVDNVISMAFFRADWYAMKEGGITGSFASLAGQLEKGFIPLSVVGINARGSHIERAKDMVSLLLSEEVQDQEFQDGLPIRKAMLEKRLLKDATSAYAYGGFGTTSRKTGESITMFLDGDKEDGWMNETERELSKEYFSSLTVPCFPDQTMLSLLKEEAAAYFEGSRSLDETVSAIAQRAQAYLYE